jgi:hypothetical protein
VLDLVLQMLWCHISKAICLGWQVYFSGGQREREIRGRRLPGLIEEWKMLTLSSSACRQKGGNVSLTNKQSKLASTQVGYNPKVFFPFCIPSYIFPTVNLFFPFLCKRGIIIICFLPLVNSWAQVRSLCFSAKATFKHQLQLELCLCSSNHSLPLLF